MIRIWKISTRADLNGGRHDNTSKRSNCYQLKKFQAKFLPRYSQQMVHSFSKAAGYSNSQSCLSILTNVLRWTGSFGLLHKEQCHFTPPWWLSVRRTQHAASSRFLCLWTRTLTFHNHNKKITFCLVSALQKFSKWMFLFGQELLTRHCNRK